MRLWRQTRDLASIGHVRATAPAAPPLMSGPRRPPASVAKSARKAAADPALAPTQFDLFPVKPVVDVLDARAVVGPRTGVEHLVRVRLRPNDAPHLIFHDRHGWYCEAHGPTCHTVTLAREEVRVDEVRLDGRDEQIGFDDAAR